MINRRPQKNTQSGFTIIETLVAIFILLISITGPLSFAQSGLRASFVARDQVVAFYLAQDAIETIKNIRDNNSLDGQDWLTDLETAGCVSVNADGELNQPCEIETIFENGPRQTLQACPGGNPGVCNPMKYDTEFKEYRLSNDISTSIVPSKFSRTVYVHELTDNEVQIIVFVSWDTVFFADRRIVVQENIYNWVPIYTSN